MADEEVGIGRVKRDISELVNRVAYGGERIILTSRGKPKAALVSMDDYARLAGPSAEGEAEWQRWIEACAALADEIRAAWRGLPLDVEALWESARSDLEGRDERLARD
jgi:prevent-host-death family protein